MTRNKFSIQYRDLAEAILNEDVLSHNHGDRVDDLSSLIQRTVEDWLAKNPAAAIKPKIERAELGMDGNCGFALLGHNIQEGEVEFEEVRPTKSYPDPTSDGAKKQAITRAYVRLKTRLEQPISYFLGPLHPDFR